MIIKKKEKRERKEKIVIKHFLPYLLENPISI